LNRDDSPKRALDFDVGLDGDLGANFMKPFRPKLTDVT
jgi:hypothetical protein